MTKPFKLRLHLPSFQLCRSKKSSTLAKSPSPPTHTFPSVNPKAFDITYPNSPAPPPSTPDNLLRKRNTSSKILPIGFEAIDPRQCTTYVSCSCKMESPAYGQNSTLHKLCNSPDDSDDFDQSTVWPFASLNAEMNKKEGNHWVEDQSATSFTVSISSANSGWLSSEDSDDPNDESEGLLSSCSSLESSCDFGHPVKPLNNQKPAYGNVTRRKKKNGKIRRWKRYVSNSCKDDEKIKLATTSTMLSLESDSSAKKTVLGRLLPCVDGKVNESYAIMKKSADPFDDFKMSMLEMILEKQISEQEDLEKLLICFLSLNSKEHHEVIVAAFTEVWDELFSSDS